MPCSIDTLAAATTMDRCSFTRYFKKLTGQSVGRWLLNIRLRHTQQLLEGVQPE